MQQCSNVLTGTPHDIDSLCTQIPVLEWISSRSLLPMVEFPVVVDDACSRDSTSVDHSVPVAGIQILAV